MRTFLAIVGLSALLGGAGWIGSRSREDPAEVEVEIDPFEGIELPYRHEKSMRITCSRQAPSKARPSRDCVQRQAAALKEHQLMQAIYPNGSRGLEALTRCEARATNRNGRTVDFVLLVECANRKLGNIEASRLGNVEFLDRRRRENRRGTERGLLDGAISSTVPAVPTPHEAPTFRH